MKKYVIITWPESQDLMEKKWWNECHLINDEHGLDKYGSSAFFVPVKRLKELTTNNECDATESDIY